jgi:hypothetical protein
VVIKGRGRDPRVVGNLANPGGCITAGGEEPDGSIADANARVRRSTALSY